jgi:hypothetical protein
MVLLSQGKYILVGVPWSLQWYDAVLYMKIKYHPIPDGMLV